MVQNINKLNAIVTQEQNSGSFSGTDLSMSMTNEQIIIEAYERIGIVSDVLSLKQVSTALASLNFILTSWANKRNCAWLQRDLELPLKENVSNFLLVDDNLRNFIKDITNIQFKRYKSTTSSINYRNQVEYSGVPTTTQGGNPLYAFDLAFDTSFTQTAPNGKIRFTYAINPIIKIPASVNKIAVASNGTHNYTLRVNWLDSLTNQTNSVLLKRKTFKDGDLLFLDIPPLTNPTYIELEETGGSTLNLKQIYLASFLDVFFLTEMEKRNFLNISSFEFNRGGSNPYCYFFNKQINPSLSLYPSFSTSDKSVIGSVFISYISALLDTGSLQNLPEVPPAFLESLVCELSLRLAQKESKLDLISLLTQQATQSFAEAVNNNETRTTFTIMPSWDLYS